MLSVENAILGYNGTAVLQMDKLALASGESCLLIGPSGCGKTTLLYAIAGLIPVMSGSIRIGETDIAPLSESARDRVRGANIGIIFQTLHLVASLNVLDNLMLASFAAGVRQNRAHALSLLERLGIADKAETLPGELSQGEAQRVAIARALLNRPLLLLADEPTSSLDDASAKAAIALIREMAAEANAALFVSTHDARIRASIPRVISLEAE